MAWYLDTSAAVKLVRPEVGTAALHTRATRPDRVLASSLLLHTELLRAVRRAASTRLRAARDLLERVVLLGIGRDVCERAALLGTEVLRSLDAVHLASALTLAEDLEGVVTYDARLAEGAEALGLVVTAPV